RSHLTAAPTTAAPTTAAPTTAAPAGYSSAAPTTPAPAGYSAPAPAPAPSSSASTCESSALSSKAGGYASSASPTAETTPAPTTPAPHASSSCTGKHSAVPPPPYGGRARANVPRRIRRRIHRVMNRRVPKPAEAAKVKFLAV
ncbi:hypothetical protein H4S04_008026, partial [Coemansia sp. S16]